METTVNTQSQSKWVWLTIGAFSGAFIMVLGIFLGLTYFFVSRDKTEHLQLGARDFVSMVDKQIINSLQGAHIEALEKEREKLNELIRMEKVSALIKEERASGRLQESEAIYRKIITETLTEHKEEMIEVFETDINAVSCDLARLVVSLTVLDALREGFKSDTLQEEAQYLLERAKLTQNKINAIKAQLYKVRKTNSPNKIVTGFGHVAVQVAELKLVFFEVANAIQSILGEPIVVHVGTMNMPLQK